MAKGDDNDDSGDKTAEELHTETLGAVKAVLSCVREDDSDEVKGTLARASIAVMHAEVNEALIKIAAQRSGSDIEGDMRTIRRALDQALSMIAS